MKALITTQDGQVKTLNGKAYVMSNGQQVPLQQGDFVAQGSEVFVDNDAQIELLLSDGSSLGSEAEVPQEALQSADSATDSEIAQLQALIAAGEDPTASLPDTAAGGAQGNEGTSGFVSLARSGAETLAASGYDSAGVEADAITLQDGLSQNTFELTQVAPSTVTLLAPTQVNEGGSITYTAVVDNAPLESDLVLTLSNGATIVIPVGQTSGSVTVDAPSDDVYLDSEVLNVGVTESQGGNYENLDLGNSVDTQVNDTIDTTTVTLTAPAEVNEGGQITYTATVNNAPETDLVLTLSNGASITIAAGQTSGTVTVDAPTDDVYQDGETLTVNVTGAQGGNYENLDLGNSVDTQVNDTIDTTTVTLTAPAEVNEGGQITYTATVNNAPETDLVLTLSNGASITIAAGQTEGTVTVDAPTDDVYQDGEILTVGITDAQGGNYEDLNLGNSVDTQVNDTIDTTAVTLTAPAEVNEGGQITYTATVNNAPETDLVLTLSNGASITIAAGQTSGTVTVDAPSDDVFVDAETLTVGIDSAQGGNFENLDTSDTASTLVNDTTDTVFAQISVDKTSVAEGGEITYTVTLVDANGNPVTLPSGASVTLALDWSGTASAADVDNLPPSVTITGDSQQSFTVNTINDGVYENSENLSVVISGVTDVDNSLEQLEIGSNNSADTTILDAQDAPVVGIVAEQSSVTEGETAAFTVSIDQVADEDVVVNFTYSGVAEDGTDFTGVASVTIPAGSTSVPLDISTINDGIYEGAEDFTVTIDSVSGADASIGANNSADTTILDAQNPPSIGNITNVAVSEEGLTDGLPDDVGDTDTTDAVIANGTIELQDPDNDELEVTLSGPSGVTSGGVDVTWSWDASTQTLTGSAGSTVVMTISLSAPAGNSSGTWGYKVTLHAPLDHPVANVEDVLNLNFGIDVADGSGATDSSSFQVTVEDDAPYMPDTAPVTATATDIPDTLIGAFDLTGYTGNRGELDFNGFTITARGFTSSTDHTLTSANINGSSSGIGVASVGSPYHNIANEVDFREFTDGTGVSEEVIIDLDPNTLAFGMKIEFANIFGGELESGVVEFWRDGQLISTQTFSSDAGNGDYAADFNVQDGGFDRVVIKATDNGTAPSHGDNSDFTISSIEFTGTGNAPAIAYASGEVTAQWGADGQGSLALAGVTDTSLVTASGEAVEVTLSGNTLLGQTDSGDLVFKLEFTPGTGHWDFYQYQTMQGTEDGDLDFAVTVTDADGDSYTGNIAVVPVFNYQVTEAGPGDQTVNLGNAEDIVIGDLDGTVVVPGQDYNIAFMVDSSGSINTSTLNTMKSQLAQVFETLKDSAGGEQSGTVKIFLVDFDTHAKGSISVDLNDPNALSTLQNALNDMSSGGGTNYEDVFTTTANWFANGDAQDNSGATNLAFFITDGKPTYYNANAGGNPKIYDTWWSGNDRSLSQVIGAAYVFGQVYTVNGHVVIDESGNVFSVEDFNNVSRSPVGAMRPDAQGNYDYYALAGTGSSTNSDTTANSEAGFALLSGLGVTVEAIGMGSNIDEDDLQSYDTDGNVQTNIDADELADAILGNEITNMPGSDTLDGGAGNDIIFGDVIRFDGIQGQGYNALKAFIAGELGQSDVTDAEIHNYISEHSNLFDKSSANDKGDIIRGGDGSDILFGQGGNDELYGGNGNDMLFGGNGNDLLVGGNGDDWLTGGQGVDTFSWKAGETGTDHITDFELNKDQLNLSDLLLGEEHNSLEQYFEFSVADGNTTISIDADLDGEFDQHIVLDGVDLFATYGSDESDIINGLLGNSGDGPLIVDTQSGNPGSSYVSQTSSSGLDEQKTLDSVF
ncbi:retention module-containing protein [Shewanella algae]